MVGFLAVVLVVVTVVMVVIVMVMAMCKLGFVQWSELSVKKHAPRFVAGLVGWLHKQIHGSDGSTG